MQLRSARLCLDCEELHEDDHCPMCASEAFAFLTRWVPVDERRERRRPARPAPPPATSSGMKRFVKGGAIAVAAVATGRWLWESTRPPQKNNGKSDTTRE